MARYEITDLATLLDANSHLNDEIHLMNDLDLSETESLNPITISGKIHYQGFLGIGSSTSPLTGGFHGNGFKIKNLRMGRLITAGNQYGGFINSIERDLSVIVTNGNFATAGGSGWSTAGGTSWTFPSGYALCSPATPVGTLSQPASYIQAGSKYRLSYRLPIHSTGTVQATIGGVTLSLNGSATTFTEDFTALSDGGNLVFTPSTDGSFRLDDISITRITEFDNVIFEDLDCDFVGTGSSSCGTFCGRVFGSYVTGINDYTCYFSNISISGQLKARYMYSVAGFTSGYGGSSFTNCSVDLVIDTGHASTFVGGFISTCSVCGFSNCVTRGGIVISVESETPYSVSLSTGGFIASVWGGTVPSSRFDDCRSEMSVSHIVPDELHTGSAYIGGFFGYDPDINGVFNKCSANGNCTTITDTSGSVYIGGFSGVAAYAVQCYATGDVIAKNAKGAVYAGGFCGSGLSSGSSDCYAWGDIMPSGTSASALKAGGFCGATAVKLTRCYSAGKIGLPIRSLSGVGGFIGVYSDTDAHISCYFDKEKAGISNSIGPSSTGVSTGISGKLTSEMIQSSTFSGWDFTEPTVIWYMGEAYLPERAASGLTVWVSASSDFENFEKGTGDSDAFEVVVPSTDTVKWISAMESLIVATSGGEWKISSNRLDTPITATNFGIKQQSYVGSYGIQPVKTSESILYVDFVRRKIREMAFDAAVEKYVSPDMNSLSDEITVGLIKAIAYQKNPDCILWCVLDDGTLLSFSYDREQSVTAWAEHPMDGKVVSVAVLSNQLEDEVWIGIERTIGGSTKTYIECLEPRDYGGQQEDQFYLDSAVKQESVSPFTVVTGLSHLEGKTVSALANGSVVENLTVSSGQITLPSAATKAIVGLPYRYVLQPMRINTGEFWSTTKRINKIQVSFYGTLDAKYGISENNLFEIPWRTTEPYGSPPALFNGEKELLIDGGFTTDVPIIISGDSPNGCNIRCLISEVDITDK